MIRKPLAFSVAATLVVATLVPASSASTHGAQETAAPAAAPMFEAWQALAAGLEPELMQAAAFAFDDARRTEWFYTPVDRVGLRVGDLNDAQRARLRALLEAGLGGDGTDQAFQIVQLEEVLFATSGGREMRNPGNYYLMMFGVPSTSGPWGWRFEGHHLSTSFTVIDDRVVSSTPAFFGGNPAHVPEDSEVHPGLRPFGREQDLGFELLGALDEQQRARAIIEGEAPRDILTGNAPRADLGPPQGIAVSDMSEQQRQLLMRLMSVYGSRMNPALIDYQLAKIRQSGIERVHFAWAGGTVPGEGHYYRIQGPTFAIEYDNTQGNANHVHSVWRDFADDLGHDPLRAHLAASHGIGVPPSDGNSPQTLGNGADIEDDERAHRRAHARGLPHGHSHER